MLNKRLKRGAMFLITSLKGRQFLKELLCIAFSLWANAMHPYQGFS